MQEKQLNCGIGELEPKGEEKEANEEVEDINQQIIIEGDIEQDI